MAANVGGGTVASDDCATLSRGAYHNAPAATVIVSMRSALPFRDDVYVRLRGLPDSRPARR